MGLADTITKYIIADLNKNLKGFILNSKNSLKNFIQQKINERLFPENKQGFIYEKMKEILQASFKEDYDKEKNCKQLYNLSFDFADEFKAYIKDRLIKSLEDERKTRLKIIRDKSPNSELFMENYLSEEYKLIKNDDFD